MPPIHQRDRARVDDPPSPVDLDEDAANAALRVARGETHDDVRREPSVGTRRPGKGGRRGRGRRIDIDHLRMFCLREPREIHREVIHGMDSLPDDERSGVDEPDASVDLVGNIRDPACGVRRAQGDGHRGHEPTVRARGSRQGGGRRRGNRIDRDGPRLRQLHEPCHVGCMVFDEMHAIGQGERAGVGRPIASVHAVHQAGDSARRVRGVQVHRHAADVPWAVARDSRQARVGGGPRRVDQDRPGNPGLHVPGKIGSLEVDRMTAFGEDEGASVRPPRPSVNPVRDVRHAARRVRRVEVHGHGRDEPAIAARRPGQRRRRHRSHGVDLHGQRVRGLGESGVVRGVVFDEVHALAEDEGNGIGLPRTPVDPVRNARHAARQIRCIQDEGGKRDVPAVVPGRPGGGRRRDGFRRVDLDAYRMADVREARDIRRVVVERVSPFVQEEGSRVEGPGASVNPIGEVRHPARGVRRTQDDCDNGDVPTIVAKAARQGRRGNGRRRVDSDHDVMGRLVQARAIRRVEV